MNSNSKVALFDSLGGKFAIKKIDEYHPAPGELLVRVTCCTICGSDLHTYCGRRSCEFPTVLGHEIIGIVEGWSDDPPTDYFGSPVNHGQRITWGLSVGCRECKNCQGGLPQKCESLFKYGHSRFDGVRANGGLAEYCVLVPGTAVFPIPDSIPDEVAAPANCATATVMAAIRMAEEVKCLNGKNVLITGCGMLGLTACAVSASRACRNIVAVEINRQRRELAMKFGATASCHPDQLKQLAPQDGFDIALDFSGVKQAIDTCLSALVVGGTAILAGSVFPGEFLEVDPERLVRSILTIRGIHNYRPEDLKSALEFLTLVRDQFPFEALVSETYGLDDVEKAFSAASKGNAVRIAIVP